MFWEKGSLRKNGLPYLPRWERVNLVPWHVLPGEQTFSLIGGKSFACPSPASNDRQRALARGAVGRRGAWRGLHRPPVVRKRRGRLMRGSVAPRETIESSISGKGQLLERKGGEANHGTTLEGQKFYIPYTLRLIERPIGSTDQHLSSYSLLASP